MRQKNILVSILINNYNNESFIKKCVQSCLNQSYKNIEIIICDDVSSDKSIKYIKNIKSKRVKKIFNKKKYFKTGRLNQFYAIRRSFLKSKGEIIFLLDGDDAFLKNKVKYFVDTFKKNKKLEFLQDNPINYYPKTNLKEKKILKSKKFVFHTWPYFNPTSTMAFQRHFFENFLKEISFSNKKFETMAIDARAIIYVYFFSKNFKILNKYLTIYTQNIEGYTISKYNNKGANWWKRRLEFHKFVENLFFKKKKTYYKLLDYYLTYIINLIYKKLRKF